MSDVVVHQPTHGNNVGCPQTGDSTGSHFCSLPGACPGRAASCRTTMRS
jgi:hypothetical protein